MKNILLLMNNKSNQKELSDFLSIDYPVEISETGKVLEGSIFDLCIADSYSLYNNRREISKRRKVEEPLFLPFLLVCSRKQPANPFSQYNYIDEILYTPVEKVELKARVENLIRARRFTQQLRAANEELYRKNTELEKANSELDNLNKQKNYFLGMASHDLRNPLQDINGVLSYMKKSMVEINDEEKRQLIEKVQERSEFMLNIVEKFLSISKMEAGNIEMNLEERDIIEFASNIVDFYNHMSSRKKITIFFQSNINRLVTKFDANRLEQVFTNLLSNAVKFSMPGKSVYMQVKLVNNNLFFYVIDEGQGIPASEVKKLFVPFSKTSVTGTANEPSTGLGLAIAKKIVELHGGRMFVESTEGKGSTFYFSLPVTV